MKQSLSIFFISLGISFSLVAVATPIEINQNSAKTSFVAIGKPAMLRIHGEEEGITSKLESDKQVVHGSLVVSLDKFKTGIDTRDEHMKKKYLEVDKYPEAVLAVKDLSIADLKSGSKKDLETPAQLTLHGQTKDVKLKASLELLATGKYKVHATTQINLSDFKIDIPTYAGIKVADTVEIEVNFETK